jgi:transglutaminase-like putative cysteine protease
MRNRGDRSQDWAKAWRRSSKSCAIDGEGRMNGSEPIEPRMSTALRAFAYAVTGAVFAWPLSVFEGVVAGALGAAFGSLAGRTLAATRVRTPIGVGAAIIGFLLSVMAHEHVVGNASIAAMLGPATAMRVGDAIAFGLGSFALGAGVRMLSARRRAMAVLELGLIAASFATLVIAHRHGAIHRPFEIADPILARGEDPERMLLAFGVAAGAVIGILLLRERSLWRSLFHLAMAAALLFLIFETTSRTGVPPPPGGGDGLNLRDDGDREGREREGGRGQQGGSGGPDFEDEYDQSGAQTPLAVALLHDDYSPPSGVYYFRQEAFSQYNGRRLVKAQISGVDEDVVAGFPTRTIDVPSAPEAGPYRTTVETTVGLLADHPRPFGLESPIQLVPVENPNRGRFRRTYRVRSAVLTSDEWGLLGARAGDARWSAEIVAHYTGGPNDPRYAELGERILSEVPEEMREDPFVRAVAITQWLGREGTYSLRSRHADAEDPTAHFLFGDLIGYCVHFAHAAVYLMRSVGLPARVATGYMVPESGRRGGSAILIAGANSHAWPEVYLDGVGWVVVDVMPERSLDPPPSPADEQLQQMLAEMLRGLQPIPEDEHVVSQPLTELARSIFEPMFRASVIALGIAVLLGFMFRTGLIALGHGPNAIYRSAMYELAMLGVRRTRGESREAFARRIASRVPSLSRLTATHGASAWGGRVDARMVGEMRVARRALRRELAKTTPFWRRLLALLDPFSWMLGR